MKGANDGRVLVALLLGVVLLRLALVASLGDVFYSGEELAKSAAARALVSGTEIPSALLIYHAYEGGGFVVSYLEALVFALLGPSLLSLKLVALGLHLGTLAAGALLCSRAFGRTATRVFVVLAGLAPIAFQKLSLLALGIHLGACIYLALILWSTLRLLDKRDGPAVRWALHGLLCGLGIHFNYQIALTVGFCGLVLLIARPREVFSRRGLAGLAGGLAGLAPLGWMAWYHGSGVFDIHGGKLLSTGDASRLVSFAGSLTSGRPPDVLMAYALRVLASGAACAWLVVRAPQRNRLAARLIVGYLAFFILVYANSAFAIAEALHFFYMMRLAQVWFLCTLLVAGAAGVAWDARESAPRTARVAAAAVLLLALSGAADFLRALGPRPISSWSANLAQMNERPGYIWRGYVQQVARRLDGDSESRARAVLSLGSPLDRSLRQAVGWHVLAEGCDTIEEALATAMRVEPGRGLDQVRGLGPLWFELHGMAVPQAEDLGPDADPELLTALQFAAGLNAKGLQGSREYIAAAVHEGLAAGAPPIWFEGLGWRIAEVTGAETDPDGTLIPPFMADDEGALAFIAACDERARESLLAGYQAARAAQAWR